MVNEVTAILPVKKEKQQDTSLLIHKAGKGDQKTCQQLYDYLDAEGTAEGFVHSMTDTPSQILTIAHEHLVIQEALRRRLEQMKQELGWETATALERLLIERIVLCWHHLYRMETGYQRALKESLSLEKSLYYQKVLDRAQKRHLAAIQSLALVRRLQIPPVQVNIADKQMNVVQGAPTPNALPSVELTESSVG